MCGNRNRNGKLSEHGNGNGKRVVEMENNRNQMDMGMHMQHLTCASKVWQHLANIALFSPSRSLLAVETC